MKYIIILIQFTILTSAIAQGIEIDAANGVSEDGIRINHANGNGVHVGAVLGSGVNVGQATGDGIRIGLADAYGVYVADAGKDGVAVGNAIGHGIFVENASKFSMNIQGVKNDENSEGLDTHIAQIYNRSNGNSADVLALKIGRLINPSNEHKFISFFNGNNTRNGSIRGNGSGGVEYATTGADFAECLTPVSQDQNIRAGDIVGVHAGKISLHTQDAAGVMVITDQPAVLGNQNEDSEKVDEKVSFIGQVLVNVRGEVHAGDWIVASDDEDGTGIAVPSSEITLDHQIVGKAWESNQDPDVKKVNTVVGLDHSEAKDAIIRNMESKMTDLQSQIDELKKLITKG